MIAELIGEPGTAGRFSVWLSTRLLRVCVCVCPAWERQTAQALGDKAGSNARAGTKSKLGVHDALCQVVNHRGPCCHRRVTADGRAPSAIARQEISSPQALLLTNP